MLSDVSSTLTAFTIMHLSELGDEATIIVTPAVFVLTVPLQACV